MAATIERELTGSARMARPTRGHVVLAACCFAAIRVWSVAGLFTRRYRDTRQFEETPVDLMGDEDRLWFFPALLDALRSDGLILALHVVVSVASFVFLASTLADRMATRGGWWTTFVVVLTVGCSPRVMMWDLSILTESLTISTSCVVLATLVARPAGWSCWVFLVAFVPWVFLRDAHTLIGVVVAAVAVWRFGSAPALMRVGIVLVALWGFAAGMNNQWVEEVNATGNLAWTPIDEGDTDWLLEHGAPAEPWMDLTDGRARFDEVWAGGAFYDWVASEGPALWPRYLLDHPDVAVAPLGDWETLTEPAGYTTSRWLPSIWLVRGGASLALATSLLMAVAAVELRARRRDLIVPLLLATSTIPHHLMVMHGAPIEHARHGVLLSVLLAISIVWIAAALVDRAITARTSIAGS